MTTLVTRYRFVRDVLVCILLWTLSMSLLLVFIPVTMVGLAGLWVSMAVLKQI